MKIVCLIPARGGSKRIPLKNIRFLDEMPLIAWSIATARALDLPCYVSSDDKEILRIAGLFGAKAWDRPARLAGDDVTDLPVVEDFLQRVEPKVDLLIYLRPTTPTRSTVMVQGAIDLMLKSGNKATGLRSIHRMTESCFKRFMLAGGLLEPLKWQGQDLTDWPEHKVPPTYKPNGYIDIIMPSTIEAGSLYGESCIGYVTRQVIELDSLEEWNYLDYRLKVTGVDEVHEFYLPGGARAAPFGI